jgi:AraC-like DNA-binding protein/lambda repressor-like predicted transcriptional regulator
MRRIDTIATWAQVIVRALEADGISSAPLLREAGIDPSTLHDANQRIAQANMSLLWRAALRVSGDECFGLRVARCGYPTDFHGLSFAMQSSFTLSEALERSIRYSSVISTSADMQIQRLPGVTRLVYGLVDGVVVERIATEAFIASAVQFAQQTWREAAVIKRVCLSRPTPANPERWAQLLGCPVSFDAPVNAIDYDNAWLQAPLRTGNSEVARGLDLVLSDYLERQRRSNLPERVRSVIARQLPLGEVQQSKVADELGMSVRNLHRHLHKHASSFKDLLDESRRQLAITYLRQSHCSINEICYRLGFNEPSSFNRAFRRWTGCSPGQWRREELTQSLMPVMPQRLKPAAVMSPFALAV